MVCWIGSCRCWMCRGSRAPILRQRLAITSRKLVVGYFRVLSAACLTKFVVPQILLSSRDAQPLFTTALRQQASLTWLPLRTTSKPLSTPERMPRLALWAFCIRAFWRSSRLTTLVLHLSSLWNRSRRRCSKSGQTQSKRIRYR